MSPTTLLKSGTITLLMAMLLLYWSTRVLEAVDFFDQGLIGVLIQCACLSLGAAGVITVLRGLSFWLVRPLGKDRSLRVFPDLVLRNVLPLRRHRPMAVMNELPHFPLFWCSILMILIIILMTLLTPLVSRGLLVKLGKPSATVWQQSPSTETLGVYIGGSNEFHVNGKLVAREELRAKLKEELGKRIVWTVYLEANENCQFREAVYAMDAIQGLGAKLVWLTPRTREEFNRQAAQ
jgi:biopolymer transport protein ExbD